jgi:hypothetical protein
MPQRGSCGPFCRVAASRSNTRRSIYQPSVAALHAPAETPTALSSVPRYADIARRLVLASRLPSRGAPALNPHSARCSAGAKFPATSCLGAFWTPAATGRGRFVMPASKNLHNIGSQRRSGARSFGEPCLTEPIDNHFTKPPVAKCKPATHLCN